MPFRMHLDSPWKPPWRDDAVVAGERGGQVLGGVLGGVLSALMVRSDMERLKNSRPDREMCSEPLTSRLVDLTPPMMTNSVVRKSRVQMLPAPTRLEMALAGKH